MNPKKINSKRIRSRLIRKGFFTQVPLEYKDLEPEASLFRSVLDVSVFELTDMENHELRKENLKWVHPESSCANDFNQVCEFALIKPEKARTMILNLLDKYFPKVLTETSCKYSLEVLR
jgi:hypothetical protein